MSLAEGSSERAEGGECGAAAGLGRPSPIPHRPLSDLSAISRRSPGYLPRLSLDDFDLPMTQRPFSFLVAEAR